MNDQNYVGNISTLIKFFGMTFAGWIIGILASQGLNLGVDATTLGEVIGAFLGLCVGYLDAKYPNTFAFLGNNTIGEMEEANIDSPTEDMEEVTGGEWEDGA